MSQDQLEIASQCRAWFKAEQCPLPVDLHLQAEAAGLDTEALEESCLHNDEVNQEDCET